MRTELRYKSKDGAFLPAEGREDERDMEVEVVHYSALEKVALGACEAVESDPRCDMVFSWGTDFGVLVSGKGKSRLPFSLALEIARQGGAIQREGWNGADLKVLAQFPDEHSKMTEPYLYIEYPDGRRCPWLASQTDLMAKDWRVLAVDAPCSPE
jgi:hypothetical protein